MCALRSLSDVLAAKAALELNEKPEQTAEKLQLLRTWLQTQQQTHFKARTCDQFLIAFLRSAKFSMEKAKRKIENFYTYRALMPELYANRDLHDPKIEAILRSGCFLHLPQPIGSDGPCVIMMRVRCFDLDRFSLTDIMKMGAMAADILLYEDDNAIVAGYVFVMDLSNIPKAMLFHFEANFVRKLVVMANKICPARMKGFHFLNVPPIFEKLFNLIRSVISEKLQKRIYVHSNFEKLHTFVPRHILPKEYGGPCQISDIQETWWKKLNEYANFFEEEANYGIIDNGASVKLSNADTTYGVEGSFRQLSFD